MTRAHRLPVALAFAACLLYAASWRNGFAGDDAFVVVENAWTQQGISSLPNVIAHSLYYGAVPVNGGLYRPLAGAYYVIVGALTGLRPEGFHIANILLYGLNVATVFYFLRRLSPKTLAAPVLATVLFLIHPIHTEVVNNIKSADEMLCLQFLLLSGIAWLEYCDTGLRKWWMAAIAAYACAVGSKETAVPMFVVLPALGFYFRKQPIRRSLFQALPFAVVASLYLGVRYVVLSGEPATHIVTILNNALLATDDRATQLASALAYLLRYMRMLFWPHPLSFDYGYNAIPLQTFNDPIVWLAIAMVAGLFVVLATGARARRVESFAALWFIAAMAVVSNVLFLISTNFGERLLYLPSVAACYLVAVLLCRAAALPDSATIATAFERPAIAFPTAVIVLLGCMGSSQRTHEWRSQTTLFKADVKKYPNSARLNNYFGNLLYFEGEQLLGNASYDGIAKADLANAKHYLRRGLSILDRFGEMHTALGMAEYRLNECKEAVPDLKRALAFAASRDAAVGMLADCYKKLGDPGGSLSLYRTLEAEGIDYPPGLFELGNDATARGDDDATIRYFSKFLSLQPSNVAGYFNLASAFRRKNLFKESIPPIDRCVELQPTPDVAAKCLLLGADSLMRLGRQEQAYAYFAKAKAMDPNSDWIRK